MFVLLVLAIASALAGCTQEQAQSDLVDDTSLKTYESNGVRFRYSPESILNPGGTFENGKTIANIIIGDSTTSIQKHPSDTDLEPLVDCNAFFSSWKKDYPDFNIIRIEKVTVAFYSACGVEYFSLLADTTQHGYMVITTKGKNAYILSYGRTETNETGKTYGEGSDSWIVTEEDSKNINEAFYATGFEFFRIIWSTFEILE